MIKIIMIIINNNKTIILDKYVYFKKQKHFVGYTYNRGNENMKS